MTSSKQDSARRESDIKYLHTFISIHKMFHSCLWFRCHVFNFTWVTPLTIHSLLFQSRFSWEFGYWANIAHSHPLFNVSWIKWGCIIHLKHIITMRIISYVCNCAVKSRLQLQAMLDCFKQRRMWWSEYANKYFPVKTLHLMFFV